MLPSTTVSTYRLVVTCLMSAVLAAAVTPSLEASATSRPNVVLFLVDDMGWIDCEPYGSKYYETPSMTRLSKQAMLFTDAYAVPLCSPTRASILTGQYSSRHGITSANGHQPAPPEGTSRYPKTVSPTKRLIYADSKRFLDPDLKTLPEVLLDAGYRTAHIGKWHLGLAQQHWPDKHGFEVAFHAQPSPGPPGSNYFSPYGVTPTGKPSGKSPVGTITDGPKGEYITDRLTDEAVKFIEANRDKPFYLNLWQYGVHGPWGHKEEYTVEFAKKNDPRGHQRNPVMASMLKSADQSLGRVMDKLDELKLTNNTIFIFYSDNGGNVHSHTKSDTKVDVRIKRGDKTAMSYRKWAGFEPPTNNAPLREGKARIYEGGQRVPLIIRWPGRIKPGSTTNAIVGPIDLYPTLLDALKIKSPKGHIVDGESLLPVLEQRGQLNRNAFFTWFPHIVPAISVRQGDYKLIHRFEPNASYPETSELYNLKDDIGETKNLADAMPEKAKALRSLIDGFIKDTRARAPKANPAYDQAAAAKLAERNKGPQPGDAGKPTALLLGLVPKGCKITTIDGAIRVSPSGGKPFLGSARVRLKGALTFQLSARTVDGKGGVGRIQWRNDKQTDFPAEQSLSFKLPAGKDWQQVRVNTPIIGTSRLVRIYLPDGKATEIRSIRWTAKAQKGVTWDLSKIKP